MVKEVGRGNLFARGVVLWAKACAGASRTCQHRQLIYTVISLRQQWHVQASWSPCSSVYHAHLLGLAFIGSIRGANGGTCRRASLRIEIHGENHIIVDEVILRQQRLFELPKNEITDPQRGRQPITVDLFAQVILSRNVTKYASSCLNCNTQ